MVFVANMFKLVLLFILFILVNTPVNCGAVVTIHIDRTHLAGVSRFQTGVTHTQYSLDAWGDSPSIERAKRLLSAVCQYGNQHIMGWGATNPEPSPGVYHWEDLDRRIALIRSTHAEPVITLCGAPDWMKGGKPGETDWSKLEVAPLPAHYADFAALARTVALRYPDVRTFQVWNEMKGFWKPSINNWDYEGYTDLYNMVYDALKSVSRAIKVGGPYLVIEGTGSNRGDWSTETPIRTRQWQIIDYWLQHKHGADFITLDRGLKDYHDHYPYTAAELMALTPIFEDIAVQVRRRTSLPLWWAEYYGSGPADRHFVAAQYASIMIHMIRGGTSAALLWQPQDAGGDLPEALFTDTRKKGGGQPLPFYAAFKAIHDHFGPGTKLYQTSSSSPDVEALASPASLILINKRLEPVAVSVDGKRMELGKYEVRVVGEK